MKITKHLLAIILSSLFLLSCSSDDEDNNPTIDNYGPQNVFAGDLLQGQGKLTFKYNADGLLEEVSGNGTKSTFRYPAKTKSTNNSIIMEYNDTEYPEDSYTFHLELGQNGFVKKALQIYSDNSTDTWEFGYNSDGQLNYMKRSEGDNEVTNITYTNGNITNVEMRSDDPEEGYFSAKITYTSSKYSNGIDNKSGVMFFDDTFGIDMDEMEYVYYAGLLGHPTKKLPLQMIDDEDETENFNWTLNENGYPIKLIYAEDSGYPEKIDIKW